MTSTELMGKTIAEQVTALIDEAKADEGMRVSCLGAAARLLPGITTEAERHLYPFIEPLQALAAELEAGPAGGFDEEAVAGYMALMACAERRGDALLACLPILVNLPTRSEQRRFRIAGPFVELLAALSQHQHPTDSEA